MCLIMLYIANISKDSDYFGNFFINQKKNKKFNIKMIFSKQTYQLFDKIIKKMDKTMLSEFSRIENLLKTIIVDGVISVDRYKNIISSESSNNALLKMVNRDFNLFKNMYNIDLSKILQLGKIQDIYFQTTISPIE